MMQIPFLPSTPPPPKWLPHTQTLLTEGSLSYRVAIVAGSAFTVLVYTIIRDTLHHSKEAFNTLTGRNVQHVNSAVSNFLASSQSAKEAFLSKAETAKKAMVSVKDETVDFVTTYKMEILKGSAIGIAITGILALGYLGISKSLVNRVVEKAVEPIKTSFGKKIVGFGLIALGGVALSAVAYSRIKRLMPIVKAQNNDESQLTSKPKDHESPPSSPQQDSQVPQHDSQVSDELSSSSTENSEDQLKPEAETASQCSSSSSTISLEGRNSEPSLESLRYDSNPISASNPTSVDESSGYDDEKG